MTPNKSSADKGNGDGHHGHHLGDDDKYEANLIPIPGNWPRIYMGVLCYLFILIAGLYVLSRLFTY